MKFPFLFWALAIASAFVLPDIDAVKLNQIQVIGSHNSYKQAIEPALLTRLKRADSTTMRSIEYSHVSLSEQLNKGLQNLEIDIYADEKGGKYAHPKGLDWATGQKPYDVEGVMKQPGFKVFHIQDIDFRSNCPTFAGCLQELKQWSDAHPNHYPVFITMNAKDEVIKRPGFTVPEKFTTRTFDQLDSVILNALGRTKLITPDDVRGQNQTLEGAVRAGNWPTVKAAKGKFMFVLDETGEKRAAYIAGHPSLKGRMLFANAEPGTPEAAFIILNNPITDAVKIQELVKKGYIVRTRADADTKEARANDKRTFDAACQSGAQIITTDYYAPSTFFKSDYVVSFDGGKYLRLNPSLR
ncbi:phosphatidylinositol-specific phospholipase C1-like protein [Spirosoma soli]|uniref:Phosphatidylinositol-specific phospholipase C1-like protein n=1 Tax=Spirosoma soli TaxID=1770529 RepID=A0ABW5M3X8_9BACT